MVLPIALLTISAILIIKGFTGASLSDIIDGNFSFAQNDDEESDTALTTNPATASISKSSGSPISGVPYHSPTHITAGLPDYPAYDYMAPAGTTVIAPVSGTVFKLSGKDPRLGGLPGGPLGYSIYIKGDNGKRYFLTHLDKVQVRLNQRVSQGQSIAVVANGPKSWSSPHVHMGVSIL